MDERSCDMVGVLSDLAVDEGEEVKKGQVICLIESMKIMFEVRASRKGRVHYLVELGEIVGEGEPVAEIV